MYGNLNKIFWGLIFISININVPIDILPDIVGYGLIFSGLNKIVSDAEIEESTKKAFSLGVNSSLVMIGVEVVNIVMYFNQNALDTTYNHIYTAIISIVSISHVVMIFSILNGIHEALKSKHEHEIMEKVKHTWYTYLVLWLLSALIKPLTLNIDRVFDIVTIDMMLSLVAIVLFITQIYIIVLLRSVRNMN